MCVFVCLFVCSRRSVALALASRLHLAMSHNIMCVLTSNIPFTTHYYMFVQTYITVIDHWLLLVNFGSCKCVCLFVCSHIMLVTLVLFQCTSAVGCVFLPMTLRLFVVLDNIIMTLCVC